jgi:hypothetical protein
MTKGIYLPADELAPLEVRDFADFMDYQSVVGGLFDVVDLPDLSATVYVNDEGLIIGLPVNPRATYLWWLCVPAAREMSFLVGDAVIIGMPDDEGNNTDIPQDLLHALTFDGQFRVEVVVRGDPNWYTNIARYPNYWDAAAWAGTLRERWTEVEHMRVVPHEPEDPDWPSDDDPEEHDQLFDQDDNPEINDPT